MASAAVPGPQRLVLADLGTRSRVRDVGLVVAAAGITGLAAQLSIHTPFSPVPFTLQTLTVLVAGAALGARRGAASMLLYLVAGVLGVPWFAGAASGWGGVSFGYVLGFVAAAAVAGYLAARHVDRRVLGTVGLMVTGNLVIYAVGATWLALDLHISVAAAFDLGVRPFLATDAIKVALAALALPSAWKLAGHGRPL